MGDKGFGISSPILIPSGQAHLDPHQEGQLCCAAPEMCRANSPTLLTPGPALSLTTGLGGVLHSLTHYYMADENCGQVSHALLQGCITCISSAMNRVSPSVLPGQGAEPALMSSAASEGQLSYSCDPGTSFSHLPPTVRDKGQGEYLFLAHTTTRQTMGLAFLLS